MTKSFSKNDSTCKWGSQIAKLQFVEQWEGTNSAWRRLPKIEPGQSWFDLPKENMKESSQHYVKQLDTDPIPPEAAAAQLLIAEGAEEAYVIENWNGIGVMSHHLRGVEDDSKIWEIIKMYKKQSGKPFAGGFPDVVALWSNGSVSMCEVKIKGKDCLSGSQISGVDTYVSMFGDKLDLRVFEWNGSKT